ncbi:MAG: efflux RND transporter periplasmic adaptor subunit [Acidobacteria bacterium]|nr:efflux RND transporter periplasmic adaptor subunit [Acidobacteriota bacterium]
MLRGSRARARRCRRVGISLSSHLVCGIALVSVMFTGCARASVPDEASAAASPEPTPASALRLTGTVEAVQSTAISVPRLQGPMVPLLIVGLVKAGTQVKVGDPLVEFDRQQQERDAFDRRAELVNVTGEIAKKKAEQAALEAKDLTELKAAEHDVARAELEVRKNELIAAIDAEKNTLALEQAKARYAQLETTYKLKRTAAEADLRILEIRQARAERALSYAEGNAKLMLTHAPFSGLVVMKRMYRNGQFVEIAEGDEVRPGTPVVDIVDTSKMRVRAKVNQADVAMVRVGQRVKVGLDGFPDLVFDGTVDSLAPLASPSQFSQTVRTFIAVVSVEGTHPQLLPDLTAWIDIPSASEPTPGRTAARTP